MSNFTPDFSINDLFNHIDDGLQSIIDEAAEQLFNAGKKVVDMARARTRADNGFGNITWELRNSIGCLLVNNNQILDEHIYFPPLAQGIEGTKIGISYAREIALLVSDGSPVLIFVAGMDYAAFVESTERDVISMSSLSFGKIFKQLINQI
ncbi:hypothetical protein [Pedobacter cryotolerans]|nr:hypothetical protein [Pedobacter cryotolerans]